MRPDDLIVLLEIARGGTLSAAGAALGIDHSTVSRKLAALERDLGAAVVVRGSRGYEPTDLGRQLLDSAEQIERALAAAGAATGSNGARSATFSGLVRVQAPEAFGAQFVAPVLARMHRDFPAVTLELVTATRAPVQGSGADIEIGVGDAVSRRIESFRLAEYTLGLYASREYLAERGRPVQVQDLARHSLVYYVEGLLRVADLDLIDRLFPEGSVHVASTSVHAQVSATQAGGGIGVLPNFLARRRSGLVHLLPAEVQVKLHLSAALAPKVLRRPAALEVVNRLRQEVTARRAELLPNAHAADHHRWTRAGGAE